jgi:hypothetical protein
VTRSDLGGSIVLTVYTDQNNWSEYTIGPLPTVNPDSPDFDPPITIDVTFAQFQEGTGASGPADFTNVGAITMMLDGRTTSSLDFSIDLFETRNGPTAVTLSSFTADWDGDQVAVAWETALEVDTVGFNVWRSTNAGGSYVQINDTLIPAASPGGMMGGSYAFTDSNVTPGTTYYYKLEELEVGGARNWYGPVSTDEGNPNAVTLSATDAALAWWPVAAGVAAGTGIAAFFVLRRRRTSS